MIRSRRVVVAFLLIQVLLPAVLLTARFSTQGWWPTRGSHFGWQMYSLTTQDVLCERRSRC